MSTYKRVYINGASYFFTLVTYKRYPLFQYSENIALLRNVFTHVKKRHPFTINAIVILPDHIHTIWTLPNDTNDYSTRWRLIKHFFSRQNIQSPNKKIWQPRFWEHLIRDENDLKNQIDYIHYNPVKHGLAKSSVEWPNSTFHSYVDRRLYDDNWGRQIPENIKDLHRE